MVGGEHAVGVQAGGHPAGQHGQLFRVEGLGVFEQGRFDLGREVGLVGGHSIGQSVDGGANNRRVPDRNLPVGERRRDKRKARLQLFATHCSPGSQIGG